MEDIKTLYDIIFSDSKVVVITGAGISTLSGIRDFDGENGIYKDLPNARYYMSRECLDKEPEKFYEFQKKYFLGKEYEPNIVHNVLAKLQERGLIGTIITQNIDGLHEKAGTTDLVNLHGNGNRFYCTGCKKEYTAEEYIEGYICKECGSVVRPDILLYGEWLNPKYYEKAMNAVKDADKLIVLGTGLWVETVANLIINYMNTHPNMKNEDIFVVNLGQVRFGRYVTHCNEDLGEVFKLVKKYEEQ